jgi:hypothetical protein
MDTFQTINNKLNNNEKLSFNMCKNKIDFFDFFSITWPLLIF